MVFQSNTLYPSLNVYDNMAFGLRLRKSPEALVQERVKVVANMLGLNDILYKKPKVLTAAMKQRVSVARAIVREPRLYLFDDPLSGLDEKLRSDMLNVILNVAGTASRHFRLRDEKPARSFDDWHSPCRNEGRLRKADRYAEEFI